ncbi:hypothetical protein P3T27_004795 [Kitasatospora sp. MAA19]|uniref:hypothetical protein n=1 Tax=Kitasatospora sp. MAA19 TaxID=3035090 RepID=UPI0024746332|nr:hypothetical protein [Kitasatospora sp. MAA19]MDH6708058.1 hypothetical protein [Kitasatospora sp. MAA19]
MAEQDSYPPESGSKEPAGGWRELFSGRYLAAASILTSGIAAATLLGVATAVLTARRRGR